MTEKELRKLHRHDLLELLVEQSRETARLNAALREREEQLGEALEGNGRLKDKLNEKDELVEKLKARLNGKDEEIAEKEAESEEQLLRLKEKLNEKDTLVEKLKSRLDEKDAQIAEEKKAREEGLNRLKEKLDEKDTLIERLRGQTERKEEKIEKLEAEIENLRSDRWKKMGESGFPPEFLEILERLKAFL